MTFSSKYYLGTVYVPGMDQRYSLSGRYCIRLCSKDEVRYLGDCAMLCYKQQVPQVKRTPWIYPGIALAPVINNVYPRNCLRPCNKH
jgi:hypothetical protein